MDQHNFILAQGTTWVATLATVNDDSIHPAMAVAMRQITQAFINAYHVFEACYMAGWKPAPMCGACGHPKECHLDECMECSCCAYVEGE